MLHQQSNKGQLTIETLVVFGIVIAISSIILFSLHERNLHVETVRQFLDAQRQTDRLADAINAAVVGGEGFEINVTVSKKIAGRSITYFKTIPKGRRVEISWEGFANQTYVAASPVATAEVNSITITKSELSIKNINNTVNITEVAG